MPSFFEGTRPGQKVEHGSAHFELPILYFREDSFILFYTASFDRVKAAMPSDRLHPVRTVGGRGIVGVMASNFIECTVGAYGEVSVWVPAVYGKRPPPLIPLVLEAKYPGLGLVMLHMPVTTTMARDSGRGEWGFPKFTAEMDFDINPEFMACRVRERDQDILTLHVKRLGVPVRDSRPLVSYTVRDNNLIKTTIPQRVAYRSALKPKSCYLKLGGHPVSRSIQELELASQPMMSRYYMEKSVILPAGEVIESGVTSMDGYRGQNREGQTNVRYMHDTG